MHSESKENIHETSAFDEDESNSEWSQFVTSRNSDHLSVVLIETTQIWNLKPFNGRTIVLNSKRTKMSLHKFVSCLSKELEIPEETIKQENNITIESISQLNLFNRIKKLFIEEVIL